MPVESRIAEVIASNTRSWEAEVYREVAEPAFGAWVKVAHPDGAVLYGVVSHVEIGSYEPHRRAVAFGMTPEELARERPQVMALLRTTIRALVLAHRDARGTLLQTLPPHPAPLHGFVLPCTPEEVQALGAPFDYLRTLVFHPDPAVPVDDLVVAVLRRRYEAFDGGPEAREELVAAGRALSRLLDDDHERLQSILRRVVA